MIPQHHVTDSAKVVDLNRFSNTNQILAKLFAKQSTFVINLRDARDKIQAADLFRKHTER